MNSKGEDKIQQILLQNNIPFKKEKTYADLRSKENKRLRYDFYVNNSFLLEYDGEQHYKEWNINKDTLKDRQLRDQIKNEYAKNHNIPLKRIPYWDFNKITIENIMDNTYLIN